MTGKINGPHGEWCGCPQNGQYIGLACPSPTHPLVVNGIHGEYCSCEPDIDETYGDEKYNIYCHTSTRPMVNEVSEPWPPENILCNCGKPITWLYEPSPADWGCCDDCIESRRGCSCQWNLKKGVEAIWNEETNEIINPENDYEMLKDTDGKDLPCCEFRKLAWDKEQEVSFYNSVDAYARQLAKLREQLSYCQAKNWDMEIDGKLIRHRDAAAILEPLMKLFSNTVGHLTLLDEADRHGKERAEKSQM